MEKFKTLKSFISLLAVALIIFSFISLSNNNKNFEDNFSFFQLENINHDSNLVISSPIPEKYQLNDCSSSANSHQINLGNTYTLKYCLNN